MNQLAAPRSLLALLLTVAGLHQLHLLLPLRLGVPSPSPGPGLPEGAVQHALLVVDVSRHDALDTAEHFTHAYKQTRTILAFCNRAEDDCLMTAPGNICAGSL